jgi:hypothetical protein
LLLWAIFTSAKEADAGARIISAAGRRLVRILLVHTFFLMRKF